MKEQILTILSSRAERGDLIKEIASSHATPRNDKLLSLTSRLFPPTLNAERVVFMDQGQNEKPPRQIDIHPAKQPPSEVLAISPFTKPAEQILDPGLREYATSFQAKLGERPLGDWKTEELRKEYLNLHKFTSEVERRTPDMTGKEKAAAETQPYRELLTEELEKRGSDLTELFFEALKFSGETGKTQSVGAVTRNLLDYTDPILQNIVRENNNEVERVGEGNPLDPEFIRNQIQRVRNLLDQGQVDANEATGLLADLNSWWGEVVGAAETERRYGSLYRERILSPDEIRVIQTGRMRIPETGAEITDQEDPQRVQDEMDRIFNRMFDRADVSPKVEFERAFGTAGSIEYEDFRTRLNEVASGDSPALAGFSEEERERLRRRAEDLVRRYAEEFSIRQITHNANYAVSVNIGSEPLRNFIQGFSASMGETAFSKEGVVEAYHFHEQALIKIREENEGYIPPYEVTGEPGKGIRGRLEELVNRYMDARFPDMPQWKKDRAISIARGMGVISGRTIEIAAESILPGEVGEGADVRPRIVTMYAQRIIGEIAPFRHLIFKYNIGKLANRILAFPLNRGKVAWTKGELEGFKWATMVNVINGLAPDNEERFLSTLNPWKVGGILSRSSWRLADDPVASAIGDFIEKGAENRNWVGTGVQIELLRGNLLSQEKRRELEELVKNSHGEAKASARRDLERAISGDRQAKDSIRSVMERVAEIQPLKLFFNFKGGKGNPPGLQERVLQKLGKREIDRELQDDLDVLVILQEKTVHDSLYDEENKLRDTIQQVPLSITADTVGDPDRAERLKRFVDIVREEFTEPRGILRGPSQLDRFIDDLRDREWKIPFSIGTEDVPLREYRFSKTGEDTFARRWNDMVYGSQATAATYELVTGMASFRSQEPIVAAIRKIKLALAQYDEDKAIEASIKLSEGVMKYYKKDWYSRLPFFMGTTANIAQTLTGRGSSFSELAFGKGQMSWDETDLGGFTSRLREYDVISLEQQKEIQGRVGGSKLEVGMAYTRLIAPILILAFAYYMTSRAVRGRE